MSKINKEDLQDIVYNKSESDKSLDSLILQSDAVFDETALKRKILEDKISNIIDNITIDNDDNAKSIDAKVSLFKTLDDILTSREKAFDRRISIRQKQKVTDTASQISDIVTEALIKIGFNEEYVPSSKVELSNQEKMKIDERLNKLNELEVDNITEGEISKSKK